MPSDRPSADDRSPARRRPAAGRAVIGRGTKLHGNVGFSRRLANFVARHWVAVLVVWAVVIVAARLAAPDWNSIAQDGDFAHLPPDATSVRGELLFEEAFPDQAARSNIVLVTARTDAPLSKADLAMADRLLAAVTPADDQGPIVEATSYRSEVFGRRLLSAAGPNGQAAFIRLQIRREFMANDNVALLQSIYDRVKEVQAAPDFPPGLKMGVTGSAALGADILAATDQSVRNTELFTVILVVLILAVVYRAPGLVVIPLVTISAAVMLSKDLVALLSLVNHTVSWFPFSVFRASQIFIMVILFGAGTDFCLFLIARYREELRRGLPPRQAMAYAQGQVGEALAGSALTAILGLGMMVFADFGKYYYSGPTLALCLAVALLACVTLAPALLRAGGKWVFWPFGVSPTPLRLQHLRQLMRFARRPRWRWHRIEPPVDPEYAGGIWDRLAGLILARPATLLVVSLAILAPLAWRGGRVQVSYDLASKLSPDSPSVQGMNLARRYSEIGETGPVTILAQRDGFQFESDEGRAAIARLTKYLYGLRFDPGDDAGPQGVVCVRSRTEPLGNPPGSFSPFSAAGREKLAMLNHPRAKSTYIATSGPLAGEVTRLDVVLPGDPFARESLRMFDQLETVLRQLTGNDPGAAPPGYPADARGEWQGTRLEFIGTTPALRDLQRVTSHDQRLIQQLVVAAVFAVLLVILRRPVVCLYLILSVLLSYFITIGATDLLFGWLEGPQFHGLDWQVPFFLFVLLIALGQDYNIYLVTRVFEEQGRRGVMAGLRRALVHTGGIITSCGVIMAGTFVSMMTGTLRGMIELGLALSLGILLDTLVIRTVLVPAFLAVWQGWREQPRRRTGRRLYRALQYRVANVRPLRPWPPRRQPADVVGAAEQ